MYPNYTNTHLKEQEAFQEPYSQPMKNNSKGQYRPIFDSEINYCYEESLPDWKPIEINSEKEPDFKRFGQDHKSIYVQKPFQQKVIRGEQTTEYATTEGIGYCGPFLYNGVNSFGTHKIQRKNLN